MARLFANEEPFITGLFINDTFLSHSGLVLPFKIECDNLTSRDLETLAEIVARKFQFKQAIGIPRGGMKFANYLNKLSTPSNHLTLIVDDVYTTGKSMFEFARKHIDIPHIGVVIFARTQPPNWIHPIFSLNPEFN